MNHDGVEENPLFSRLFLCAIPHYISLSPIDLREEQETIESLEVREKLD